jgi:CDP-diacylglycerol---glycerol-3-phosphate 3-phosphatidyltransferase
MSSNALGSHFGPGALATPANLVTIARILLTVPLIALIVGTGPSYPAVTLWIVLSVSDGIDGFLARKHGTTRSGAFLDPLADKVLVLGALVALAVEGIFPWAAVAVIAVREVGIQGLRSYWGRRGLAVPARFSAKVKTVVQEVAIGLALLPLAADHAPDLAIVALWLAVALTVGSGVQYLIEGSRARSAHGTR